MAEAELARFIDRWTMEYVRVYPHPIDRVWRAITDQAEVARWFIPPTIWDLRPGGAYRFHNDGYAGRVQAIEPPRLLRLGGTGEGGGYTQYELSKTDGGTRLRFIQNFDPSGSYAETPNDLGGDLPAPGTPWKPGFVGGFHEFWDALGDFLDEAPIGSRLPPTDMSVLVDAWLDQVQMTHGFSARLCAGIREGLRRKERWNELNKIYRAYIRDNCPPE